MEVGKLKMEKFYRLIRNISTILLFSFCLSVNAADFTSINYKNIKDGAKISTNGLIWTQKVDKKSGNYYVKKAPQDVASFSEFYSSDGNFLFSTATQYEFIIKGSLIGYSNSDLKFYEFSMKDNILQQRELVEDEIKKLFPDYEIIKVSQFSSATNCLKIKKSRKPLKLILLNDTDRFFYNYTFTTNNSKYKQYQLKGFLEVTKHGMIQFSRFGENTKDYPWFVLLVR